MSHQSYSATVAPAAALEAEADAVWGKGWNEPVAAGHMRGHGSYGADWNTTGPSSFPGGAPDGSELAFRPNPLLSGALTAYRNKCATPVDEALLRFVSHEFAARFWATRDGADALVGHRKCITAHYAGMMYTSAVFSAAMQLACEPVCAPLPSPRERHARASE